MYKPKLLINIIPICEEHNTVFIGKRVEDLRLSGVCGKLKYGEEFNDAAYRLMKEDAGLAIEDRSRFHFICSYNIVDKDIGIHFVGYTYYLSISKTEVESITINKYIFSSYVMATMEDIIAYLDELYIALSLFISKYSIKSIEDIKLLNSN